MLLFATGVFNAAKCCFSRLSEHQQPPELHPRHTVAVLQNPFLLPPAAHPYQAVRGTAVIDGSDQSINPAFPNLEVERRRIYAQEHLVPDFFTDVLRGQFERIAAR